MEQSECPRPLTLSFPTFPVRVHYFNTIYDYIISDKTELFIYVYNKYYHIRPCQVELSMPSDTQDKGFESVV